MKDINKVDSYVLETYCAQNVPKLDIVPYGIYYACAYLQDIDLSSGLNSGKGGACLGCCAGLVYRASPEIVVNCERRAWGNKNTRQWGMFKVPLLRKRRTEVNLF